LLSVQIGLVEKSAVAFFAANAHAHAQLIQRQRRYTLLRSILKKFITVTTIEKMKLKRFAGSMMI